MQKSFIFITSFYLILFIFIHFVLGFDGLYGQDAYEYLRYTNALKKFILNGTPPGDYFWGIYYPVTGSLLSFITNNSALALQLISFVSLLVQVVLVEKIISVVYQVKVNKIIPFLFVGLSPILLTMSFLVMSDMMASCFILAAFYCFIQYLENYKEKHFLIGIALSTVAILTRYVEVLIIFPILIYVLILLFKNKKYKSVFFALLLFGLICLPHFLIRTNDSLKFINHNWLTTWNITNLFQNHFETVDGIAQYEYLNLTYCLFPFYYKYFFFFGGIILLFTLFFNRTKVTKHQLLLLTTIGIYIVFIGGISFQNNRFLIPVLPLIVVLFYPSIDKLFQKNKLGYYLYIPIILVQLYFFKSYGQMYYTRNQLEQQVCQILKPYEGNTLYSFDIDIALQGRQMKFNYHNLFLEKFNTFENNALVLINENNIEQQWVGKSPFINWKKIENSCSLIRLKQINNDWTLYQIVVLKK